MGYEVSVVQDAIGDREIPGATAEELVRVSGRQTDMLGPVKFILTPQKGDLGCDR